MDGLVDRSIRDYLAELAVSQGGPGAGSTAALVGAAGAALIEMAARASREEWTEAGGAIAQAAALRRRLEPLAQADADALEEVLARLGGEGDGDERLGRALGRAASVPLQIAEAAADVAELAAEVSPCVRADVRADACSAALFAEAAVRTGARLVEVNLATLEGDERLETAKRLAQASTRAASRALATEV